MKFKAENWEVIHSGRKIIERQNKVKCTTLNQLQEQTGLVYMSVKRSGEVGNHLIKYIKFYALLTGALSPRASSTGLSLKHPQLEYRV